MRYFIITILSLIIFVSCNDKKTKLKEELKAEITNEFKAELKAELKAEISSEFEEEIKDLKDKIKEKEAKIELEVGYNRNAKIMEKEKKTKKKNQYKSDLSSNNKKKPLVKLRNRENFIKEKTNTDAGKDEIEEKHQTFSFDAKIRDNDNPNSLESDNLLNQKSPK